MTDYSDCKPSNIRLRKRSRILELDYAGGQSFSLPCEFLRVYSPSAEVRGHGAGQEVLQTGKLNVNITAINPVGRYALQLVFDDGHDTGLYSWDYLYELCTNQGELWQAYIDRMDEAGATRDPDVQVVQFQP